MAEADDLLRRLPALARAARAHTAPVGRTPAAGEAAGPLRST